MNQPEILMLDRIGGAYSHATLATRGLGGSEIEMLQVARGLTAKGHSVVVANDVDHVFTEDGVTFVPHSHAWQHRPTKALYLQRFSVPETQLAIPSDVRVIVRANDVYCPPYDVHRDLLTSGRATLVTNTKWQASLFGFAKDIAVVPPMLEPMPKIKKQRGLFVFASGAMKGFEETVHLWCEMKQRHPEMKLLQLAVMSPGWGTPRPLTELEFEAGIWNNGSPTPKEYRRLIAKAEGLFTVLTMPETFGCAAALAERAHTRTHILCKSGFGGLKESVSEQYYITDDQAQFEKRFLEPFRAEGVVGPPGVNYEPPADLRPAKMIDRWAEVLHVDQSLPIAVESTFPADPTLAPNKKHLGPFFGDFLSLLRGAIEPGGSEFGVGLMLFSLATAIQAREIVEIGRFKGFSSLALMASLRLQVHSWIEPKAAEQRPDVDYASLRDPYKVSSFTSIDPVPLPEADAMAKAVGMTGGVFFINQRSETVTPMRPIDLLLIDGDHSEDALRADIQRFVPFVRPGGYFVLHDYFGWFTPDGQNGSPIAKVIAEELTGCDRVLIDTHYASLVIFRKAQNLTERWELDPKPERIEARADGRPTVGLVVIAKGDEASTVATRAISSAKKVGVDCVTVVCDANDATADVARSLGADVFIRPSPAIDWEKGIGVIAGARNEALAIAERRTDYLLVLDADDWLDGALPTTLDRDVYELTIHDFGVEHSRIQLFRSALHVRYQGIIHEIPCTDRAGATGHLPGVAYHRGKSSYGYQDQDVPAVKYAKHAHLISKWLLDHPDDARAQFYLAQSYRDAGRPKEAIEAYEKRIGMLNGWNDERYHSAYQIGLLQIQQGTDPTLTLLRAHEISPVRAEPLCLLAQWYRDEKRRQFSTAYAFARRAAELPRPSGVIFIHPRVYQFEAAAEVAIAAYWLGRKQEALERFEELLPRVPADQRKWAESQIALCVRELSVKGV